MTSILPESFWVPCRQAQSVADIHLILGKKEEWQKGEKPAAQVNQNRPPHPPLSSRSGSTTASCLQPHVNSAVVRKKLRLTEEMSLVKFSSYIIVYLFAGSV